MADEWLTQFPVVGDSTFAQSRTAYVDELANPAVRSKLFSLTHNEVGGQGEAAQQAFIESVFNRAQARGRTLAETILDPQYYPAVSLRDRPGADYSTQLDAALKGSNVSRGATGNASGTVGFAGGPQTFAAGGERFGVEGPDLTPSRWLDKFPVVKVPEVGGGPREPMPTVPGLDLSLAQPQLQTGADLLGTSARAAAGISEPVVGPITETPVADALMMKRVEEAKARQAREIAPLPTEVTQPDLQRALAARAGAEMRPPEEELPAPEFMGGGEEPEWARKWRELLQKPSPEWLQGPEKEIREVIKSADLPSIPLDVLKSLTPLTDAYHSIKDTYGAVRDVAQGKSIKEAVEANLPESPLKDIEQKTPKERLAIGLNEALNVLFLKPGLEAMTPRRAIEARARETARAEPTVPTPTAEAPVEGTLQAARFQGVEPPTTADITRQAVEWRAPLVEEAQRLGREADLQRRAGNPAAARILDDRIAQINEQLARGFQPREVAPEAIEKIGEEIPTEEEVKPSAIKERVIEESDKRKYPGNGEVRAPAAPSGRGGVEPSPPEQAEAPLKQAIRSGGTNIPRYVELTDGSVRQVSPFDPLVTEGEVALADRSAADIRTVRRVLDENRQPLWEGPEAAEVVQPQPAPPPVRPPAPVRPAPPIPAPEPEPKLKGTHAETAAAREAAGIDPYERQLRQSWGEAADIATRYENRDPGYEQRVARDVAKRPGGRTVENYEHVALLRNWRNAEAEAVMAREAERTAPNKEARDRAQDRVALAKDRLQEAFQALDKSGSAAGKGLQIRQMILKEFYSPEAMEAKVRAAKGGKALTEKEAAQLQKHVKEMEGAKVGEAKAESQRAADAKFADKARDSVGKAVEKSKPKTIKEVNDVVMKEAEAARKRLIEERGSTKWSEKVEPCIL